MAGRVGEISEACEVHVAEVGQMPGQARADVRNSSDPGDGQRHVEQREDAEEAADIERADGREWMAFRGNCVPRPHENSGDQKTAEYEEQLDADSSKRPAKAPVLTKVVHEH